MASILVPRRKTVFVSNGMELLRKSGRLGFKPEQVFLKHKGDLDFTFVPNKHRAVSSIQRAPLEYEFSLLRTLHEVLPQQIVMPIVLVRKSEEVVMRRPPIGTAAGYLMEFVDGTNLYELYRKMWRERRNQDPNEKLTRRDLIRYIDNAFSALEELHRMGLGHGDVSMSNMIVTKDGSVKLFDPIPFLVFERIEFDGHILHDRKCMEDIRRLVS